MRKNEKNRAPLHANKKLFQNYYTQYMVDFLANPKNFGKNKNPLLLDFFHLMHQHRISEIFFEGKKLTDIDQQILTSFIRSYFFSVAFELSLSYAEQLDLLAIAPNGVKRFSEYIAKCCIPILKDKDASFAESLCKSLGTNLKEVSLKSLFVFAGINQETFLQSKKSLLLYSQQEVSIDKFFKHIGLRVQLGLIEKSTIKKGYQYYHPSKNSSIEYGYRNAIHILQKTPNGAMRFQCEPIENKFVFVAEKLPSKQESYSYVAGINDIREYLDGLKNVQSPMHEISQNGFSHFISQVYFPNKREVIVVCLCLNFNHIIFEKTNFNDVYFTGCDFNLSDLTKAWFQKIISSENIFNKTILNDTYFDNAVMDFSDLSLSTINGEISFKKAKLSFGNIEGVSFVGASNFEGSTMVGTNCEETDFNKSNTNDVIYLGCSTAEVRASPDKRIKLKIFDNDGAMRDIPFQPYLISDNTQFNNISSLLSTLFNDELITEENQPKLVTFSFLSKVAYGLSTTNHIEDALSILKKNSLSLKKKNRQRACIYFMEFLARLHTRKLEKSKVTLLEHSIENLITTHLDPFLSEIKKKNLFLIEEYASILAEDIFYHNRKYFSVLVFSELEQGTFVQQSVENAPNFVAMTQFSDRLTYKVCQDILAENDPEARTKIYQLYLLTALKLCNGFEDIDKQKKINDLQGASSIVMAFCHHSLTNLMELGIKLELKDSENLSILLKSIFNPSGNFKNLHKLTTEFSIPYLAQLSKDRLFSIEGSHTLLLQMASLGKTQKNILNQQISLEIFKGTEGLKISTDLVFILKKIDLDIVNIFILSTETVSKCSNSEISILTSSSKCSDSQSPPQISQFTPIEHTLEGEQNSTQRARRSKSLQRSRKSLLDSRPSINIDQTHTYEEHSLISKHSSSRTSISTSSDRCSYSQSPPQISLLTPTERTFEGQHDPTQRTRRSKGLQRSRKSLSDSRPSININQTDAYEEHSLISKHSSSETNFSTSFDKCNYSESPPQISQFMPIQGTLEGEHTSPEKIHHSKSLQRSRKSSYGRLFDSFSSIDASKESEAEIKSKSEKKNSEEEPKNSSTP